MCIEYYERVTSDVGWSLCLGAAVPRCHDGQGLLHHGDPGPPSRRGGRERTVRKALSCSVCVRHGGLGCGALQATPNPCSQNGSQTRNSLRDNSYRIDVFPGPARNLRAKTCPLNAALKRAYSSSFRPAARICSAVIQSALHLRVLHAMLCRNSRSKIRVSENWRRTASEFASVSLSGFRRGSECTCEEPPPVLWVTPSTKALG